ncbi:TPA: transcription-repair coupling factor [Streptococcus suis]|uniref:Transcription-repair-coupling factor n=3 Tax=Streptococcus suis TaxID=1307 RepID=A0A0Z8D181_STRSU|nr:transcription-repair coupling factor [Streptococcus suis]AEB80496.1 transcription-repair coupling factor [Streptococcus suis ST3]AER16290.1 transcription-repair coupling factor [Streptococcus suis D9]AGW86380.1 Transcription-repair coupling factor [Streptococcus suis YB51]AHF58620.1 Transcription-repair coupling factor [Streptococcus suis 05HAS68]ALA27751.1 transcription-repair coupling factor [Streptococcus suis]
MNILDLLHKNKQINQWQSGLNKSTRQLLLGLTGTSKSLVMATAYDSMAEKIMIVTATQNDAEKLVADLVAIIGSENVYNFFTDDSPIAEFVFASKERTQSRIDSLNFLTDSTSSGILVASMAACRVLLPSPETYKGSKIKLEVGQEIEVDKLVNNLVNIGYKKVSRVLTQGEFSQRGDILDIFDMQAETPYRIEFFGDEIDGIRIFDVDSQKSLENLDEISISPASDIILSSEDYSRASQYIQTAIEQSTLEEQQSYLREVLADMQTEYRHPDLRKFLSCIYEQSWTLLDYLPKSSPLFLDDFHKISDKQAQFEKEIADLLTDDLQKGKTVSSLKYFASTYAELRKYKPATFFSSFQKGLGNVKFDALYQFTQHPMQEFFHQIPLLKDELTRYAKSNNTVVIQASSDVSLQTLQKTLQEYDIHLPVHAADKLVEGQQQVTIGQLASGFHLMDEKLVFITEKEIFNKKMKRKTRRTNISNAERIKDYSELAVGDYVVHHVHGIGQYLGIETIEISGIHRDYLTVQYQNFDRISIPVEQIDLLSKYLASDGKAPKVNKLNDGRFQRTKQKVQKQVEDIADDLIKLYAERSQLKGFAFSPDDENQIEFDNYFTHVETDDQLRSIDEIKQDMEKDSPMDRLLVGDVGFGKTEVAMRAAFKAVNDGKQVAILVPTTVLAQQHYANFQERFAEFPVNVDVMSRFKTKAEQEKTLEKLKKGQVDILIGTHRLLSKDVVFADLGLLVIDEEQRFGVKHKERLKELKKKIDVLTLTATPIPRTLQMSMLGIRDLSVIETPPTNRYPVQTYVMETNPSVIRDAMLREIDRGGQVYYLYNKVDTIEQKVSELKELVPEATIGYVHGQMSEIQLENTLYAFVEGEYDILVTTTIIETGVDIPNANTLFIENADHMGLSTLYQLRGRVGRSSRIAYAYLMYRPDKSLTEVAEKRLEAIKGFTELGSGFKIAMQDLSIRGAGNILGAAQSGFIDSVGYEMYSQLLEQAILEKQGKATQRQKSNSEVNLQIDAYLPSDYIGDQRQKIEIYKRIKNIDSRVNYQELQEELIDRFGEYPDVVAYLLEIGLLKSFLDQVFCHTVLRRQHQVTVTFEPMACQIFLTQDYFEALSVTNLKAQITENKGKLAVVFNIQQKKEYEILEELISFAEKLKEIKARKAE